MNIDIDELATLVASQLTTASAAVPFSILFNCEFNDTPIFDHSELVNLKVCTSPVRFVPAPAKAMPGQPKPRHFKGINEYQYVIALWIEQNGPDGPPSTGIDPIKAFAAGLRRLVQEILHWLNQPENRRPHIDPDGTSLWLKTIDNVELYDVAALKLERRFESHTLLTYEEYVRE